MTDPAVLATIEPNATLLRAVLRTKHLMNPEVLRLARRIVETVVRDLLERLRPELRQAFSGARSRRPSRFRQARDFDFRGTIRANLAHYQPAERRILIENPRFHSRTRRRLEQWQLILLVDQSGSMAGSVVHSAVTAACPGALDALAGALSAGPGFVSGALRRGDGTLVIDPIAVMTGEDVIVPDLAAGDGDSALGAPSAAPPDELGAALDGALARLAEAAHRGLRHVTPAAYAGVEEAVRALTTIGLHTSAEAVTAFLTALRSGDAEPAAQAWVDARLLLTTCAELR